MYKLFLTFRYLTRKAIVIFPILVVWLCVMMMIIVTSIMGGFVERVQSANRQLLGDIVIEGGARGWPYYAEFQKVIEGMPEVEASTPVIHSAGLINLPDLGYTTFAQVIGIEPTGRAKVSGFHKTLFHQYTAPMQAAEDFEKMGLPATGKALEELAAKAADKAEKEQSAAYKEYITYKYSTGAGTKSRLDLLEDQYEQKTVVSDRTVRTLRYATEMLDKGKEYKTREELEGLLVPKEPSFDVPPRILKGYAEGMEGKKKPTMGCIVGVDIGRLNFRSRRGDYIRPIYREYVRADLTVVPVTRKGTIVSEPSTTSLVVVDDSYSRVYDVDSTYVFAPFEEVQRMALMQGYTDEKGRVFPARCSGLHIKTKGMPSWNWWEQLLAWVVGRDLEAEWLRGVRQATADKLEEFGKTHAGMEGLLVRTWDQKQAQYIDAVRNEKRMLTFILGLMSLVVLVVIFLIFYMIVRDKTKDIGIIKALGGSEEGVAGIFMLYGLFIGCVGGLLGVIGGVWFVWRTNEIHEFIFRTTGVMIWNRSVYMFDEIPHTVNWWEVLLYFGAALVAGWLGATIPAIIAGVQNPVEAVRYE